MRTLIRLWSYDAKPAVLSQGYHDLSTPEQARALIADLLVRNKAACSGWYYMRLNVAGRLNSGTVTRVRP